jgi:chromate reductase, NAD(P)H dehydrogenase (quinone)
MAKKNILIIVGSSSQNSSNENIANLCVQKLGIDYTCTVISSLKQLPFFTPENTVDNVPQIVLDFRQQIEQAKAIIISTPEYVFSIPAVLKNALEWCVAATVFSNKVVGLITASAHGEKGHQQLKLITKTLGCIVAEDTSLLISGIKSKLQEDTFNNEQTKNEFAAFIKKFSESIEA